MNGFLGVCDVLSGDVNPSGHISDTYATSSVSAPAMTNFGLYTYTCLLYTSHIHSQTGIQEVY